MRNGKLYIGHQYVHFHNEPISGSTGQNCELHAPKFCATPTGLVFAQAVSRGFKCSLNKSIISSEHTDSPACAATIRNANTPSMRKKLPTNSLKTLSSTGGDQSLASIRRETNSKLLPG